jgi:hypothetical protein
MSRATDFLDKYYALPWAMAVFNDLAIELQEAIWELVLPTSRGVHWIEVEGIPQAPEFIRDSIRMTQWHRFHRMPEMYSDICLHQRRNPKFGTRAFTAQKELSSFFCYLLTTVPAVFRRLELDDSKGLKCELADEIVYTSRCRQLLTYYQIVTLLLLCWLLRIIAQRYV